MKTSNEYFLAAKQLMALADAQSNDLVAEAMRKAASELTLNGAEQMLWDIEQVKAA
tara:strand:- start:2575 stop:2742 length:168 start_codon:yes stop_codon:yes gene_type:complete